MGLQQDNGGISQILGTMMVIAIAVTLAIVVGIMLHHVAQDKGKTESSPALGMAQVNEDDPAVQVLKVPTDIHLRWGEEIGAEGTCDPLLNGQPFAASIGQQLAVPDTLSCDPGETLRIVYHGEDGGSVLYRFEFD